MRAPRFHPYRGCWLKDSKEAVSQILSSEPINSTLAYRALERATPIVIPTLRVLSQTSVRGIFVRLVASDQCGDGPVVHRLFLPLWVTNPSQHFTSEHLAPLLEVLAVLQAFEIEIQALGPR